MEEAMTMSNEQQEHVDMLRSKFRAHADAAREYDRLADQVQELRHLYSREAHAIAVDALRMLRDSALRDREDTKAALQDSEGWQTARPT
jgi:hypothetical protein